MPLIQWIFGATPQRFQRALADSSATTDAAARVYASSEAPSENVAAPTDALTRAYGAARAPAESVTISDALTRLYVGARAIADSVAAAVDALARAFAGARGITESVTSPTDGAARSQGFIRNVPENSASPQTVSTTLHFDTDLGGLLLDHFVHASVAFLGTDSSTGSGGCASFTVDSSAPIGLYDAVLDGGANFNAGPAKLGWSQLGVPRNAIVTKVQVLGLSTKVVSVTGLDVANGHTLGIGIDFSDSFTNVENLYTFALSNTMDPGWVTQPASGVGDVAAQASSSDDPFSVYLSFRYAGKTNALSPVIEVRVDEITFQVTYIPGVRDDVSRVRAVPRALADSVSAPTDALVRAHDAPRALAESTTTTDALTRLFVGARAVADSTTAPTDAVARTRDAPRTIADAVTKVTDALTRVFVGFRAIADSIAAVADDVTRSQGYTRDVGVLTGFISNDPTFPEYTSPVAVAQANYYFTSDLQGLASADASNASFSFVPGDGGPISGNGCAAFVVSPAANPGDDIHCVVNNATANATWETFGVPHGGRVLRVGVHFAWNFVSDVGLVPGSDQFDLAFYSNDPINGLDNPTFGAGYVLDPAIGFPVTGLSLDQYGNFTPGWQAFDTVMDQPASNDPIGSPSDTPLVFWMQFGCSTDAPTPNIELRVDDIQLSIDYVMALSDSVQRVVSMVRLPSESVAKPADALSRAFAGARAPADSTTTTDDLARVFVGARAIADSTSAPTDAIARVRGVSRALADSTPAPTDALARLYAATRAPAESVTISDALARVFVGARAIADALTAVSDAVARTFVGARVVSDATSAPTDAVARIYGAARAPNDSVPAPTDSVARHLVLARAIADALTAASDSVARAFAGARAIADSTPAPTDTIARVYAAPRAIADATSAPTDAIARMLAAMRNPAESVTISDALARAFAGARGIAESVTSPTDSVVRDAPKFRQVADSAPAPTDAVARAFTGARASAESVPPTDAIARVFVGVRVLADAVQAVTDGVAGAAGHVRAPADSVTAPADGVMRLAVLGRLATEAVAAVTDAILRLQTSIAGSAAIDWIGKTDFGPDAGHATLADMSYSLIAGDLQPDMEIDVAPPVGVTLVGALSVNLRWKKPDGTVTTVALTAIDLTSNPARLKKVWAPGETDLVGQHYGQVVVALANSELITFPADGSLIVWNVYRQL